jgi:hypothetical protein
MFERQPISAQMAQHQAMLDEGFVREVVKEEGKKQHMKQHQTFDAALATFHSRFGEQSEL